MITLELYSTLCLSINEDKCVKRQHCCIRGCCASNLDVINRSHRFIPQSEHKAVFKGFYRKSKHTTLTSCGCCHKTYHNIRVQSIISLFINCYIFSFIFSITRCINRGIASMSPPHWQNRNHMECAIDLHAVRASSGVGASISRCAFFYDAAKTGRDAFHVVTAKIENPYHSYIHRDNGLSITYSDKQTRRRRATLYADNTREIRFMWLL